MDVRCEKCQTEYELDETKLKPGGVTVKCTTCGHMFKVRRQPPADMATPAPQPVAQVQAAVEHSTDFATPTPGANPMASRASSVLLDAEDGERTWLIRLEDGEIKTCRELSTLQKWIVSGRVSRGCSISRTGKKWKLLGEIGELASFFGIADEAREARVSGRWATGGDSSTQEYPSSGPYEDNGQSASAGDGYAPEGTPDHESSTPYARALSSDLPMDVAAGAGGAGAFVRTLPLGGALAPPAARDGGSHEAVQMAAQSLPHDLVIDADEPRDDIDDALEPAGSEPVALGNAPTLPPYGAGMLDGSGSGSRPVPRASAPAGLPLAPPPSRPAPTGAPKTGGWAVRGQMRDHGPSGPTGGVARGGQSSEAVFVGGSRGPNVRGEFENGRFLPSPYTGDDEPLIPARSRAGLWVILFSLFVMAAAGSAVYLLLFNPQEQEEEEPVVVAASDAAPAVAPVAPAGEQPAVAPTPVAQLDALAREVDAALMTDSTETLEPLAQKLSAHASGAAGSSTVNPAFLVARARVETALAQQLTDRAKFAKSTEARKLKEEARARARTAHQLADQALSLQPDYPGALISMADARRLEGERSIEVERWLRRAQQSPAAAEQANDADLVLALLRVRDDRLRDARLLLDKLAKAVSPRDVRPAFRVAWIEYLDANAESARKIAEEVIKLQPGHAGARALLDKLGPAAAEPVDTKDPMPPEEPAKPDEKVASGDSGKPAEGAKPSGSSKPSSGGAGGDSFDAVLARAEKLAENGNCGGAMPLYRKVLDMHPASVEALTGLGYCHLDRREFASAHARFRAALGISSRYQPAMWGIAEAYQQQGLKQQALERFEAFLSEHPSSPRAGGARTRIENLKREIGTAPTEGSSSSGSTSGSGSTPTEEGGQSPDSSGDSPSSGSGESSGGSESSGSGTGGDGAGSGTGAEAPAGAL